MDSYREILNIKLLHEYYGNGQSKFLQLKPDFNTQNWINQLGLKFIQTKNIGRLFVPDSFNIQSILDETPDFKMQFNCISSVPTFINFTDFPIDRLGVLVFENSNEEDNEKESIELVRSFKEDGNPGQAVALVSLSLANINSNQTNWPINYVVQFKSRLSRWKYFIVNNSLEEGTQFGLTGKGHELFSGPTTVELPNNAIANLFDSGSNLIPVKENSSNDLKLKRINSSHENTGDEILIEHLPNASPDALQSSGVNGKQEIFSAIYVYI